MFKKLPLIFTTTEFDWDKLKTQKLREKFYSPERKGGSYFYWLNSYVTIRNLLRPNLFTILPNHISFCEFTGSGLVTPHKDKIDSVALNFYLDTDDGITIFYQCINHNVETLNVSKRQLAFTKDLSDLIEIGRFSANKYDCYLLDVNEIHGIAKASDKTRSMITFRWSNQKFDTILNSLNFN